MAIDLVTQKLSYFDEANSIRNGSETKSKSLLDEYLKNPNIDLADITGMTGDMLLAGVDTVEFDIIDKSFSFLTFFRNLLRRHTRHPFCCTT